MIVVNQTHLYKPFNLITYFPTRELCLQYMQQVQQMGFTVQGRFCGGAFEPMVMIPEDGNFNINSLRLSELHKKLLKPFTDAMLDKRRDNALQWEKTNGLKYS